ncbi:MAG: tRNA lysidine(34) synthetase TilS [Bacilli bacterium]|nr:tRNA lysidine(34) synthetase TilS [Bacilli bacterium]
MNQLFNQVKYDLSKLIKNDTVVVCVSTGVDSMVLFNLVKDVTNNLIVAHVNHQQREESFKEQEYIVNLCKKLNIKCYVKELFFDTHQNFQANARNKRYEFFKDVMEKENAKYLLTAHHANDDLETIIMRLIKSTSLKGYAGIEKLQKWNNYFIYRPLLSVSKEDIYLYAKTNNILFFEDKSNSSNEYLRNRVRHLIVPQMEEENPSIYKEIEIFKEHILNCNKLLFEKINNFIKTSVETHNNIISIKLDDFKNQSLYLQEQILFELLKQYQLSKQLISELLKQINNDKSLIVNQVKDNLTFIKEYGYIRIGYINKIPEIDIEICGDTTIEIDNFGKIIVDKNICYFETINSKVWYNIYALPVRIRNRLPGDKILINGKLRSVSDYLTNKKVSHIYRDNLLVLTNKENQVLFILGMK